MNRKGSLQRTTVRNTIKFCFDDLVARRQTIYRARDGDAELGLEGEFTLVARFLQNEVVSVQSRSVEIRDHKFHNCMETAARKWDFPKAISSQKEWSLTERLTFDVEFKYPCQETGTCF